MLFTASRNWKFLLDWRWTLKRIIWTETTATSSRLVIFHFIFGVCQEKIIFINCFIKTRRKILFTSWPRSMASNLAKSLRFCCPSILSQRTVMLPRFVGATQKIKIFPLWLSFYTKKSMKNHIYQQAVVSVEEVMWDRVSYDDKASHQRQHNHAFIHTPVCTRFATVSLTREGKLLSDIWRHLSELSHTCR